MEDALANPIQMEENDVRVDTRPRCFYPGEELAQSITFPDGTRINIAYDGVLPYIPVRRPTKEEIHNCRRLEVTSRDGWDPFMERSSFSSIQGTPTETDALYVSTGLFDTDPLASNLMSINLIGTGC